MTNYGPVEVVTIRHCDLTDTYQLYRAGYPRDSASNLRQRDIARRHLKGKHQRCFIGPEARIVLNQWRDER